LTPWVPRPDGFGVDADDLAEPADDDKLDCFSGPNPDRQLPSFHQQSNTTSPPKTHVQPPVFAKKPAKTRSHHPKKLPQKSPSAGKVWPLLEDDDDGGHFVLVIEVEDLGAPTRATLRLRRMVQGCPKTPVPRSFSGERSFA
jgi:hypothetical protein